MTSENNKQSQWKAWVVTALAALLWLPMLYVYFDILQQRDSYRLWPLLAFVVIVMFILRWRRAPIAHTYAPRWALWLSFVTAIFLMLFALHLEQI